MDAKGENLVVHHAIIILGLGNWLWIFEDTKHLINLKILFALW